MKTRMMLLGVALVATLLAPTAASAKKNPYTAVGVCGAGYRVIDRERIHDSNSGRLLAVAVLTYNAGNGKNCAVTLKRYRVGRAVRYHDWMVAQVQTRPLNNANVDADAGDFAYYAGPTYVTAPNKCVRWGGHVELIKPANHVPRGDYYGGYFSGWEHCG